MDLKEEQKLRDVLMNKTKEDLIDLIINKMHSDIYFYETIQCEVSELTGTVDELLEEYCNDIDYEMCYRNKNVEYIEMISEKVLEHAIGLNNVLEQMRIYVILVKKLSDAINDGAGYQNEDDFILDEIIKSCEKQMKLLVKEKAASLSIEQYKELCAYFCKELIGYDSYDNIIKATYDIICKVKIKAS